MLESSSIDQTHKTSRLVSSNHPRPGSALQHQKRPAPLSSAALAHCVFKTRWQSHAQEKSRHFQKSRRWPDPDDGRFKQRWTLTIPPPLQRPAPKITIFLLKALLPQTQHCRRRICLLLLNTPHTGRSHDTSVIWVTNTCVSAGRSMGWRLMPALFRGHGLAGRLGHVTAWNCLTGYRETDWVHLPPVQQREKLRGKREREREEERERRERMKEREMRKREREIRRERDEREREESEWVSEREREERRESRPRSEILLLIIQSYKRF